MANRQTRYLSARGKCTRNMGAKTEVMDVVHGKGAFDPSNTRKARGIRSWTVTGKHPAHDPRRQQEEQAKYRFAPQVKHVVSFHFDSKEVKQSRTTY